MFDISVVTSMYNRSQAVLDLIDELFLPSVYRNGHMGMELIIIDDCSPLRNETHVMIERHLPLLKEQFGKVTFIRNERNLGFAPSFNRAVMMAQGKRIVVANDDLYFPLGSIQQLVDVLDEADGYLVAGPITNASTALSFQYCRQAPVIRSCSAEELNRLQRFATYLWAHLRGRRKKTDNLCGFCFAAETRFLQSIGGFDEKYRYGFFEDTALFQRIARDFGSKKIVVAMDVFVGHGYGGHNGSSSTMKQQPAKMITSLIVNAYKYGRDWGWWKLINRIACGIPNQFLGWGTVSQFLPRKVEY